LILSYASLGERAHGARCAGVNDFKLPQIRVGAGVGVDVVDKTRSHSTSRTLLVARDAVVLEEIFAYGDSIGVAILGIDASLMELLHLIGEDFAFDRRKIER